MSGQQKQDIMTCICILLFIVSNADNSQDLQRKRSKSALMDILELTLCSLFLAVPSRALFRRPCIQSGCEMSEFGQIPAGKSDFVFLRSAALASAVAN